MIMIHVGEAQINLSKIVMIGDLVTNVDHNYYDIYLEGGHTHRVHDKKQSRDKLLDLWGSLYDKSN